MKLKMRGRLSAVICLWFALEQTVSEALDAEESTRSEVSPEAGCAGSSGGACLLQETGDDSSEKMAKVSSTVAMSTLQVKKFQKKSQTEVVNALAEKTQHDELQELDETGREKQDLDAQRLFDAKSSEPTAIRWAAHPDKCLHVKGLYDGETNFVDGTNIELWNCDIRGDPLKEFLMPTSDDSLIRFRYDPTKCLAVAGGWRKPLDGANLQIWSCNSTEKNPNMQFTLPAGQGEIKWSAHMNKCIDIAGGGTSLGTNILMWNCHDEPNQQFILGPAPTPAPAPTAIRWATHPNKCLDVSAGMNKNGTNIQLWDCPKEGVHQNMQFLVPYTGYGLIRWAKHPNKCLSVAGADLSWGDGTNLQLWSCDSKDYLYNMLFQVPTGQGPIRSVMMMCVDVSGGGTAVGTNIQMWTCDDDGQHPNMQFKIG